MSKNLIFTAVSILAAVFLLVNINGCNPIDNDSNIHTHHEEQEDEREFRGYPDFGAMMSNEAFAKLYPNQKIVFFKSKLSENSS